MGLCFLYQSFVWLAQGWWIQICQTSNWKSYFKLKYEKKERNFHFSFGNYYCSMGVEKKMINFERSKGIRVPRKEMTLYNSMFFVTKYRWIIYYYLIACNYYYFFLNGAFFFAWEVNLFILALKILKRNMYFLNNGQVLRKKKTLRLTFHQFYLSVSFKDVL